jgi:SAM-dependent methyltransferase
MKTVTGAIQNYLNVVYDESRTPKTEYPACLAEHLFESYDLKPGQKFLEMGCGRGDFLLEFNRLGLDCIGVDRNLHTQVTDSGIRFLQTDLSKDSLRLKDNSIDIIYHKSVLEHVYDPAHLMSESLRLLKPKGKIIILTPDWASQMTVFYEDFTHCRPYTPQALKDLFIMNGLKNIEVKKFRQLPQTWENSGYELLATGLSSFLSVEKARWLTDLTGIKFFRWSTELMILGYAEKGV